MPAYYIKCRDLADDDTIETVGIGEDVDKWVEDYKGKPEIIEDIDDHGDDVMTAYVSDGEWVEGDEVHPVSGEYIRTDGNEIEADNLQNISDCPSD